MGLPLYHTGSAGLGPRQLGWRLWGTIFAWRFGCQARRGRGSRPLPRGIWEVLMAAEVGEGLWGLPQAAGGRCDG